MKVTCSDSDSRVLPLLRENCADFGRRHGVSVEVLKLDFATLSEDVLDENGEKHRLFDDFDLILASDVVYEHRLVKPLVACCGRMAKSAALAVELRPCGVDLEKALREEAALKGLRVEEISEELSAWLVVPPLELQVPPVEKRHRLFLLKKPLEALEALEALEHGPCGPSNASKPSSKPSKPSKKPWKKLGEEEWYRRSLHFWSQQEASDSGVLAGHVETSLMDIKESAAFLDRLRTAMLGGKGLWFSFFQGIQFLFAALWIVAPAWAESVSICCSM